VRWKIQLLYAQVQRANEAEWTIHVLGSVRSNDEVSMVDRARVAQGVHASWYMGVPLPQTAGSIDQQQAFNLPSHMFHPAAAF